MKQAVASAILVAKDTTKQGYYILRTCCSSRKQVASIQILIQYFQLTHIYYHTVVYYTPHQPPTPLIAILEQYAYRILYSLTHDDDEESKSISINGMRTGVDHEYEHQQRHIKGCFRGYFYR